MPLELIEKFRKEFKGVSLSPADPGYHEYRKIWNGIFDKKPSLIARCHSTDDVVKSFHKATDQIKKHYAAKLRLGKSSGILKNRRWIGDSQQRTHELN